MAPQVEVMALMNSPSPSDLVYSSGLLLDHSSHCLQTSHIFLMDNYVKVFILLLFCFRGNSTSHIVNVNWCSAALPKKSFYRITPGLHFAVNESAPGGVRCHNLWPGLWLPQLSRDLHPAPTQLGLRSHSRLKRLNFWHFFALHLLFCVGGPTVNGIYIQRNLSLNDNQAFHPPRTYSRGSSHRSTKGHC